MGFRDWFRPDPSPRDVATEVVQEMRRAVDLLKEQVAEVTENHAWIEQRLLYECPRKEH